jgi:mono/diheme cytochrome c family protein
MRCAGRIIGWIVGIAVVLVILALIGIYSGIYNVAAIRPAGAAETWFFGTIADRSVARHARGIRVPALTDAAMIQRGNVRYHELCAACHGAPDAPPAPMAKGLNPSPPNLAASAHELSPATLFWVTKNGIRMTGMPAWGASQSDAQIWDLIAYMETMPNPGGGK